ncbi:hypothetical protein ACE1AT_21965 [Pelatocladus sp. BLCC-F211]|uniref:hypothetical protein n=1 Tax=Pelatocladus sp. BLCC-F211 TaxID=3342752 RepID=UPI0035B8D560
MALKLNHFDTKTKQDTLIQEKLENTLAEYLFPGVKFSIGTAYPEATIPEDLSEHNGMSLQFSSGKRMFFANDPNIRQQLYPNPSDGAAYPLPLTPCRTFQELRNVRVLVVDDTTGENGGVIANNDAKKLVGDCKGLIDKDFAVSNNIESRPFQFRLGIRPQQESPVMRIAKGTLAPARLDKFGESFFRMGGSAKISTLRTKTGYDIVLATSSFKGRKGEDAIQPGEYMLTVGLGVKAVAQYREHSLGTQILVNYPKAVQQEILPIIKQQAEKLASDQKDPRRLALRYIETYERRKALRAKHDEASLDTLEEIENKFSIFDSLDSGGETGEIEDGEDNSTQQKDLLIYSLLKADLSGYCQLIEHPKIIAELQEFARKQWVEIATGRSIKFTSGLAQPSLDLKLNEICIPYIAEGEEIIVTRSPLINSNGVITLKNKYLPEMLNGCVYIHPKTAMDNMQCDFDGDLLAFAPSKDFPRLSAEVKEKILPSNRYPDIVKKTKVPYQGTFEEIAVSAMENKIGIIANDIQKNIALQCEIDAMPQTEKADYLKKILVHLGKVVVRHQKGKLQIPDKTLDQIYKITQVQARDENEKAGGQGALSRGKSLTRGEVSIKGEKEQGSFHPQGVRFVPLVPPAPYPLPPASYQIEQQLQSFKKILKDCVAELGNELQVATDGPKSALRPQDSIIQYCQAISAYKEVEWLNDKKKSEAFTDRGMKTNGYSPIDLMIKQTNQIFEQCKLIARPIEQFRSFYPELEFTSSQKEYAQSIKSNYNSVVKQRLELESRRKVEPGPYIVIASPLSGKKLEITNLINFDLAKNPEFWKASELSIKISLRKPTQKIPHPLLACIQHKTSAGKQIDIPIGTISMKSMSEHDLKPGMSIKQGKVEFYFGISDGMIDALKQQTKEYLESVRNNTPEAERLQLAAAIHDVSHTEEKYGQRRASVAFAVFPESIENQLKQLQFTQMKVIGTQFNEYANRDFKGEKVAIKFENGPHPREPTQTARWVIVEGKKLGTLDARSPHLLPGCEAIANITSSDSTSIIVTSLKNPDNKLQIDGVDKYAFANRQWQGEKTNITIDLRQTNPRQPPKVFALVGDKVLGILNKQSVTFLQQRLAEIGRQLHGFTFTGTVNHAPASYADIVIDPTTVKYSDVESTQQQVDQKDHKRVATVVFFEAPVERSHTSKTEQVMCNMVKRAVNRAIELGCDTVHFVNASPYKSDSPSVVVQTIQDLARSRRDINIELSAATSVKNAMQLLEQPNDIVIGIGSIETAPIIDYASSSGKAVVAYLPQTGEFERRNLPQIETAIQKTVSTARKDLEQERA